MAKELQSVIRAITTNDDQNLDILAQVKKAKDLASGDHDALILHRDQAYGYYTGRLPKSMTRDPRYKHFQEPVLRRMVDDWLPQQVNAFVSGTGSVVSVRLKGNETLSKLISDNLNREIIRKQKGKSLITHALKESALTGLVIGKVFLNEKQERETATIKEWEEVKTFYTRLEEGWNIEPPKEYGEKDSGKVNGFHWKKEIEPTLDQSTLQLVPQEIEYIKGKIPLIKETREIKPELVNPEDVYFDTSFGHDLDRIPYILHKVRITRGEAELKGFDSEKLEGAEKVNALIELSTQNDPVNYLDPMGASKAQNDSTDPKQELIFLEEHYIYSSQISENKETRLYQVITAGDEVLRVTLMKRMPFVIGKVEEIFGEFYGRSFLERAKPHQDRLTRYAQRAEEQADLATWHRYIALRKNFDRQSMQMNKPGVVIEVDTVDAVQVLPNPPAGQDFWQGWQEAKASAVDTLKASLGAEITEAGLPNVSPLTLAQLMKDQSLRNSIYTETFANTFVEKFWRLVYNIWRDEALPLYDDQGQVVQNLVLPEDIDIDVDYETTNDTAVNIQNKQSLAMLAIQLAAQNSTYFTDYNKFSLLKSMAQDMELDDVSFLTDPTTQVDPIAQEEAAAEKALQSEAQRIQVQHSIVEMRKRSEETGLIMAEKTELIKNGEHKRKLELMDRQIQIAKITANAQGKDKETLVKSMDVGVKRDAVEYEKDLNLIRHATDITMPRVDVNGVR